jgi:hypothetical protein
MILRIALRPAATMPTVPALLLGVSAILGACGDSISGPQGESCGPAPYFDFLPVAENDLRFVSVFGGLGAPGHTLPTAHGGMFLNRENVPLRSPGELAVSELRRVRYTVSPTRQGTEDYAIFFQVCKELSGWFGHVTSLAPTFSPGSIDWSSCETYSTSDETVQSCTVSDLDIKFRSGDALGTGGERGVGVIDFGMLDERVNHFYVSRGRHPSNTFHAVCMWEQFDAANQTILFSKLRDAARPQVLPSGEPRCGTMAVDVAGTAKGVWAETGVTGQVAGNETRYITLADYPYRPQAELALSLGPVTLGARVGIVPRRTTGRVNRAFEQLSADGQIYCYGPDTGPFGPASWFLSLTSANALRIERRNHALGASPCNADPSTWSFGAAAVSMVR